MKPHHTAQASRASCSRDSSQCPGVLYRLRSPLLLMKQDTRYIRECASTVSPSLPVIDAEHSVEDTQRRIALGVGVQHLQLKIHVVVLGIGEAMTGEYLVWIHSEPELQLPLRVHARHGERISVWMEAGSDPPPLNPHHLNARRPPHPPVRHYPSEKKDPRLYQLEHVPGALHQSRGASVLSLVVHYQGLQQRVHAHRLPADTNYVQRDLRRRHHQRIQDVCLHRTPLLAADEHHPPATSSHRRPSTVHHGAQRATPFHCFFLNLSV
ncbi:hypothetical protein E2C01_015199 [Portunus trituberculatus]|uniref:Uncharacterized protein n=1 Tax=Portunus trituberculatus TaxID=210409 RepID=A0A5B7DL17_PORTR|nr:hypothetical protein [Portunus trituberculatus]